MIDRKHTKKVKIGNINIGGSNNVIIQSMCNTKTYDVKNTVKQIKELEEVGCELVRVSIPDTESAMAIEKIKNQIDIPLVADIHFDYKLALMAIERGIDKVRINPGNIGDIENVKKVAEACKKYKVPIRIGVNGGSLSKKILSKYNGKVTSKGLYESAVENVKLLEKFNFNDIIVSIKSSDVNTAVETYKMFASKYKYPLHLGITEAGTIKSGTIKSSVGLGVLLSMGLGDTIRVSLTGKPINEIYVAKNILNVLNLRKSGFELVSCPTCARTEINIERIATMIELELEKLEKKIELPKNRKYKVAVMGCIVNGPGEASSADIGIAGGEKEALIFKRGKIISKISENEIISTLIKYIKKDLKNEK